MSTKRAYVSRRSEFLDLTVEQVQAKLPEIKTKLEGLEKTLLDPASTPEVKDVAAKEKQELINYRVRVYNRLRALGVSSKSIRSSNAAKKKALKAESTPTTTNEV